VFDPSAHQKARNYIPEYCQCKMKKCKRIEKSRPAACHFGCIVLKPVLSGIFSSLCLALYKKGAFFDLSKAKQRFVLQCSEVFAVVYSRIPGVWSVTLRHRVSSPRHFEVAYCPYYQGLIG